MTTLPISSIPFATWKTMWLDYLGKQADALPASQHETTYARLVDPKVNVSGLVAHAPGAVGFAHYYFHPSTYHASEDCCLQDLYVDPAARGRGLGRLLIDAVAAQARSRGAPVLHWKTRETNAAALALYSGFAQRTEFVSFRLALA